MKKCYDHLGNEYNSMAEMCKAYGITYNLFSSRISKGKSLEEALTGEVQGRRGKPCTDHLGNEYISIDSMCATYGTTRYIFNHRLSQGKTLEEALTGELKEYMHIRTDHLGNTYESTRSMCIAYGIEYGTFIHRISHGMTIKDALTTKVYKPDKKDSEKPERIEKSKTTYTDHLGNTYKSISNMCATYGINRDTFIQRLRRGMTLEEALTTKVVKGRPWKDHLGNEYKSFAEMCIHYGFSPSTIANRLKDGYTLEQALTIKVTETKLTQQTCFDHLGNTYENISLMCEAYGITPDKFMRRIKEGLQLEDALTLPLLKNAHISKAYIGSDGRQYYKISVQNVTYHLNVRQILVYIDKGILKRKSS